MADNIRGDVYDKDGNLIKDGGFLGDAGATLYSAGMNAADNLTRLAIGLATVARASAAAGICSEECAGRSVALLTQFGLPTKTNEPLEALFPHMLSDKKRLGGTVNVIVPERIGCCTSVR